jgi:hypothetical protein
LRIPRLAEPSIVCRIGIGAHERIIDQLIAALDLGMYLALIIVPDPPTRRGIDGANTQQILHRSRLEDATLGVDQWQPHAIDVEPFPKIIRCYDSTDADALDMLHSSEAWARIRRELDHGPGLSVSAGELDAHDMMPKPKPNFIRLDPSLPGIAVLVSAMLEAREATGRRAWSSRQEATTDYWWADVLADPRARTRRQPRGFYGPRGKPLAQRAYYTLADEPRPTILVACSKCPWQAAFSRADLIASHGAEYPMPTLLDDLAAPGCPRIGNQWDRCGVYYLNPIE